MNDSNLMTQAVLRAGLVSNEQLKEMKAFGAPSLEVDAETVEPVPLEEAAALVSAALQSEGYVLMRETDLEAVRCYLETSQSGLLHLEVVEGEVTFIEVTFGRTTLGEYLIGWRGESMQEALTNGLTYLVDQGTPVFFKDVRELFFGGQKTFMVCVPQAVDHA